MVLLRRLTLLISVLLIASTCYAGRYFDATEYATLTGLGVSTTGDTWYVDGTNGSDSYDGKAAARVGTTSVGPWRTINKAFASTTDGVNYGDHLLIRDGTYNERIMVRNLTDSGATPSESNRFKMGAYGDGEVIIKADYNHLLTWSVHSGNIYKFTYTFTIGGAARDVRCVVMDDIYNRCYPQTSLAAVNADGEWYWDDANNTLYLYSDSGTPNSRGVIILPDLSAVSAAYRPIAVTTSNTSYVTLYGISIKGSPDVGFWDGGDSHHITLDYCKIIFSFNTSARLRYNKTASGSIVNKCRFYANVYNSFPRGRPCEYGTVNNIGGDPSWTRSGFDVGTGMTLRGCIISNQGGEGVNCTGVPESYDGGAIIEDNIIYDNMSVNVYPDGMDYVIIRNNIIYNNQPLESDIWSGLSSANKITARKKMLCQGIMLGFESTDPSANFIDNMLIYNNIIIGCRSGITMFPLQNGYGLKYDKIYSNTIIAPDFDITAANYGMTYNGLDLDNYGSFTRGDVDSYVYNNLILGNQSTDRLVSWTTGTSGITINENVYYHPANSTPFIVDGSAKTFAQWKLLTSKDSTSVNDDPDITLSPYDPLTFSDYISGDVDDFRLAVTSPAIDMGATLGSPYNTDFDGVTRSPYDAGALEYISSADSTAPSTTSTLAAAAGTNPGEIDISWTSPGDDNTTGTASGYDVRWSTTSIDDAAEFAAATPISGEPTPSVAGTAEAFTVTLTPGITYYFALQTSDEVPNLSGISNSPYATATAYPVDVIAYDSSSYSHTVAANNTLTWYHSITDAPHRALVIGTAIEDYTAGEYVVTGVTYNGVAASKITSIVAGTYNSTELWYLPEEDLPLTAGGYAVTITTSGVCSFIAGGVISIYAADQLVPAIYTTKSVTGMTSITTPITTTDANTMLIDAVQVGNLRTNFTATGMTEWIDLPYNTHQFAMSTRFVASASTVSNVWTIDGTAVNNFTHAIVGFSQFIAAPDTTAPAAVSSLLATQGAVAGSVNLSWTAPGDDGNEGTATSIDVRYSTSTITAANWSAATEATGEPSVAAAGSQQAMTITGLTGGTPYFFALKTSDEVPNESGLSNVATATPAALPIQNTGGCFGYRR